MTNHFKISILILVLLSNPAFASDVIRFEPGNCGNRTGADLKPEKTPIKQYVAVALCLSNASSGFDDESKYIAVYPASGESDKSYVYVATSKLRQISSPPQYAVGAREYKSLGYLNWDVDNDSWTEIVSGVDWYRENEGSTFTVKYLLNSDFSQLRTLLIQDYRLFTDYIFNDFQYVP
jgi:hypothetical protein